jgi:hypothetical protein
MIRASATSSFGSSVGFPSASGTASPLTSVNFRWLQASTTAGCAWFVENKDHLAPSASWFGLLLLRLKLPWLLAKRPTCSPSTSPTYKIDDDSHGKPSKSPDNKPPHHPKYHHYRRSRLNKPPFGATHLGFHCSFPLRCRNANMHLSMPHPRHRFNASNWHHLSQAAHRFATQFYSPDGRREGEQQQPGMKNDIPPGNGAKTWSANAAYTWVRSDRQYFADHPIHKAKVTPHKQRFLSRKAKRNFSRLLDEALLRRPSPNPEPERPKCHPIVHQPARRAPSSIMQPSEYEAYVGTREQESIDVIFGSPKYYAIVAQEDLSADVKELGTRVRSSYANVGLPDSSKEAKLPVIWDSGARV